MDLQLMDKTKNLKRPYIHVVDIDLSSASGTDTAEVRIGIQDEWCFGICITGYDSTGLRLDKAVALSELFKFSFYDDNGQRFSTDPIIFNSFNDLNRIPSFRGFHFKAQSKITFDFEAIGFPAGPIITYPAKFKVHLFCYRLDNYEQKNQTADMLARIKQPYTFTREFDLASNTGTDSDTIDTGAEDMFIDYIKIFGLDTAGIILENDVTNQDILSLKMNHGEEQFQDGWVDILALNEMMNSIHWKGWILERKRTLEINTKAEEFPAVAIGTFPKKFQLNLTGYKIL